ncbi:S-layer homology domain-containing protein [Cohnella suwonensis]|uniref:S-layer homology domain-containing protein n=1 Tax=Cohnella suwonensis TaxID=696072 RepID=A0ABW0M227_9BACL
MKKIAVLILMLTLILQTLPFTTGIQVAHAAPGDSDADPIMITTAQELSDIRNNKSAHYKLGADIDLSGYPVGDTAGWMPIGTSGDTFTGTLDGGGYIIRNLRIDRPNTPYVGLFGIIRGTGVLKNIQLLDVDVIGTSNVGGLVGKMEIGSHIANSFATGQVKGEPAERYDVLLSGYVLSGGLHVGGLTGGNSYGTISNAWANVSVSGVGLIGGLAGDNYGVIENAFATGNVTAVRTTNVNSTNVGGLVGQQQAPGSSITHSFAAGNILIPPGALYVGGLVGVVWGGAIDMSYWDTETSQMSTSSGGTGKSTEDMKKMATFYSSGIGWDFANAWGIREDESYPYLLAFKPSMKIDPLARTTYNLASNQLAVTGTVMDGSVGEKVEIKYEINNSLGTTVSSVTYHAYADGTDQSIARSIPLTALPDGTYTLNVSAKDTSPANPAYLAAPLSFSVDQTLPVITLNGSSTVNLTVGDTYTEQGAAATDNIGTAGPVVITGTVDTNAAGTYIVRYNALDLAGNAAVEVTRTVIVSAVSASTPTATPVGGAVASGTTVALSTATGGAAIYYTTDGSTPTSASTPYTSPIPVTSAMTVKAIAVKAGMIDSPVMSESYTILSPSGSSPAVTLPVIDQNGIKLDPDKIDTTKPSVTLEVTTKDGAAYVSIPASILTSFEGKNANFFIEIKAPYGSYQVPVNLASLIPGLQDLLAKHNLKAEDISFKIMLSDKSGDKDLQAAFANGLPNGKAMGAIVDFHIDIVNTKTGQSIGTADKFSKALTRVIPMPKDMKDIPAQWGAFRYNETTKKFEFVAAKKVLIDSIWYVMISSYSNSAYVVAENAVSFADTLNHWSKSFVEMAAAKGLVEGVGAGKYAPNQSVTRAEFTAMLVRALGRSTSFGSTAPYDDVKNGAWYFDAVANAKELGLLGFASGKSFKPDQSLTREEMASMLAAVIYMEKLPMTKEFVSLEGYKDIGSANAAYLEDVRTIVKLGIMTGTSANTFSPKDETTRAQAAVVFIRTLQKLGMID